MITYTLSWTVYCGNENNRYYYGQIEPDYERVEVYLERVYLYNDIIDGKMVNNLPVIETYAPWHYFTQEEPADQILDHIKEVLKKHLSPSR